VRRRRGLSGRRRSAVSFKLVIISDRIASREMRPIVTDLSDLCTWASAHTGKWGQLTPWKMDEKLKSKNMQKRAIFCVDVIF